MLALPKVGHNYILDTYDFYIQVRCVILQNQGEVHSVPISYCSRTLAPAERNYEMANRECFDIVWALIAFRPYLDGTLLTIRAGYDSPRWMMNSGDKTEPLTRRRL